MPGLLLNTHRKLKLVTYDANAFTVQCIVSISTLLAHVCCPPIKLVTSELGRKELVPGMVILYPVVGQGALSSG